MEEGEKVEIKGPIERHFPIYIKSERFDRLLVIQSFPEHKIWFQDKEITDEELVKILESIN